MSHLSDSQLDCLAQVLVVAVALLLLVTLYAWLRWAEMRGRVRELRGESGKKMSGQKDEDKSPIFLPNIFLPEIRGPVTCVCLSGIVVCGALLAGNGIGWCIYTIWEAVR